MVQFDLIMGFRLNSSLKCALVSVLSKCVSKTVV